MDDNIKFLNQLIKIEEKIYSIYMYFACLEKSGNKDSQYVSKLEELNDLYVVEKKKLQDFTDDDFRLDELKILLFGYGTSEETGLVFSIKDARESIIGRILCQIENYQEYIELKKINSYFEDEYEGFGYFFDNTEIIDLDSEIESYYGKEFCVRLQERIDYSTKDRDRLIDEKYKMIFTNTVVDADALCTGFSFKDLPKFDFKIASKIAFVSQKDYEIAYLKYVSELIEDLICDMIWLEQNETDKTEKRIFCEIADIQLEIALKAFDFIALCKLKEKILESLEKKGMKQSLTYIIVSENLDEAINYACNNSRKLSINPSIKVMHKTI